MDETPQSPANGATKRDFLVVGLGGSAGSIPAFREFFRHVPADSGMAYVVILHLSPEYESRLAEVIQSASLIPVTQVREREHVEPNRVYVIPPNKSLSLDDGTVVVSPITGYEERRAPVDIFFRALADTHDSRAVCVVMSGSGSDGSMGLRRIKEYDGLALVQDPAEAEFAEMPRNSISTGLVDFVVPAADMPRKIIAYRDQLLAAPFRREERVDRDDKALLDIFTHLRKRTGHDFTNYKRATVMRRIERRLAVREIPHLAQYADFLRENAGEADALLRELLISVTNFFRDKPAWDKVEQTIVPAILQNKTADDHVRVWVAGCATGEEAYSMAMVLADATAPLAYTPDIQIFATDLDEDAITKARNGVYTDADTADVPPERLRRFFTKEQVGCYRVRRELREMVLFAHHNLLKDPPFSRLDLVSCRNVLIYLNRGAQERALEVLHFALEPGGYLFLGSAESIESSLQLFSTVDKEAHFYQSRPVARTMQLPTRSPLTVTSDLRSAAQPADRPEIIARFAPLDLHQHLLEHYAPPSVVVDEQYNIVHLTDRASRYLQFTAGEGSLNLLHVVRARLRIDVRTALFQAAQKRSQVIVPGVAVDIGDRTETINVIVEPVLRDGEPPRGFFLVMFEEAGAVAGRPIVHAAMAGQPATQQLEEELMRVKVQMRAGIEQYEVQAEESRAANEELQAINEELRSTAEELETSQEELQSLNEELQTVNQELKVKIDEISHANNDMRNLMSSTEIGTVFVDKALRIKLFTPRMRDIFNLIPADVGRPLLDITSKLSTEHLESDLERVLERLQTIEREVETRDGRWHLMRLLPYRTADDRIDGVVITFLDVTDRKHAQEALQRSSDDLEIRVQERTSELREVTVMLQAIVDASPLPIIAVDTNRNVIAWNDSAEQMLGIAEAEILGRPLPEIAKAAVPEQQEFLQSVFAGREPQSFDTTLQRSDGTATQVTIFSAPLRAADGSIYATMAIFQDISDRTRMGLERERLLRKIVSSQEEERQRIARELHDEMGQHLTALKVGLESLAADRSDVERLKGIVTRIDHSVDRLTVELRPPALDDLGLHGAIGSLIEQFISASGIPADVHAIGADGERLPAAIETTLYRVLQEALTNVWKHSSAKSVSIIVDRNPERVQLIVEDDGKGFDQSEAGEDGTRGRFGLVSMRERVALIGGTFSVESENGRGTTVYIRVPLSQLRS